MALEAIKKVAESEQEARARREAAETEARKIVSDAQRAGRELLAEAKAEAEKQAGEKLARAEEQAAAPERELLAENEAASAALRERAAGRMDLAAERIVRRVVSS